MDERQEQFQKVLFEVIENITRSELRNTSKHLILGYFDQTPGGDLITQARYVIRRYTLAEIPTLEDIRSKHREGKELSWLDHQILRLEDAARKYR